MRIVLPCFIELEALPPALSIIESLVALGHSVLVITFFKDNYRDYFDASKVQFTHICERRVTRPLWVGKNKYCAHMWNRLMSAWMAYKGKRLFGILEEQVPAPDLIWVLHEETVRLSGRRWLNDKYRFLMTVFELNLMTQNSRLLQQVAKRALAVVVPEYCRAHILNAIWRLARLPKILPNKPSNCPTQRNLPIKDARISELISGLEKAGKKIVLYMGIFLPERRLDTIIEAVHSMGQDYALVLMGYDNRYLQHMREQFSGKFIYAGHLPPPEHLTVASHAHIGVLTYVAEGSGSINPIFCAPNKLFEYAAFGIPMLCNDIPGLKHLVEYNRMGICADIDSVADICCKIKLIEASYEDMSHYGKTYFDSVDTRAIIASILESALKAND